MKYLLTLALIFFNLAIYAEDDDNEWWEYYAKNKTINLQFIDKVKEYTVDVAWTPDGGLAPVLTGPALINFNSKDWGKSFSVMTEYFHIPNDILEESGFVLFNKDDKFNLSVDLSKTYKVKYNSESFKHISLLDNTHTLMNMSGTLNDNYDYSNNREDIPFFFEDIDFDGIDELIVTRFGSGQRQANEYAIHKLYSRWSKTAYKELNISPFNMVDEFSTFNKENRTIDFFASGGICVDSNERFKLIDGKYQFVEFTDWDRAINIDKRLVCVESIYDIVNNEKVIKSKSETYRDFDTGKVIEIKTEYY